jgi:hypothetical protein
MELKHPKYFKSNLPETASISQYYNELAEAYDVKFSAFSHLSDGRERLRREYEDLYLRWQEIQEGHVPILIEKLALVLYELRLWTEFLATTDDSNAPKGHLKLLVQSAAEKAIFAHEELATYINKKKMAVQSKKKDSPL